MVDKKYDKLEKIRADIQKDRDKVERLLEQIKQKETKLKEAEANQIVADVDELHMSPEQLGGFLELIKSGKLNELLNGQSGSPISMANKLVGMTEEEKEKVEENDNED